MPKQSPQLLLSPKPEIPQFMPATDTKPRPVMRSHSTNKNIKKEE